MGLGDFEARQRAMKKEQAERKRASANALRSHRGGVSESDLRLSTIKKETRKNKEDAANYLHEKLSRESQALDEQFLKEKAAKEEDKKGKAAAAEATRSYKGGVSEDDLRLSSIKKEARSQKLDAQRNLRESGAAKELDELFLIQKAQKEKERDGKQATAEMMRQYKGGVNENDLILSTIKKETRKNKEDAANYLHEKLTKESQALDDQFLKEKAAKEEDKRGKLATAEMLSQYKGGVNENDLKLNKIKKEARNNAKMTQNYLHQLGNKS